MKRRFLLPLALTAAALALTVAALRLTPPAADSLPGTQPRQRIILRVWDVGGPTGSTAWLRSQCAAFEQALPGLTVYLRAVSPAECLVPDTVLPDVMLFTGGDLTAPQTLLTPLSGSPDLPEAYLQSGRWQGKQYALPLAAEGWLLAVDGRMLPAAASTPAPTSLLGRPASTPQADAAPPQPPWEALRSQPFPLAASGQGLFALCTLSDRLTLPDAPMTAAQAASSLIRGDAAAALWSTGQWAAQAERLPPGSTAFVPPQALAPRMLYGGIPQGAQQEAAAFLAFLCSEDAQRALARQHLFPVLPGLTLYGDAPYAPMERTLAAAPCPLNAFWPTAQTDAAAREAYLGTRPLNETLAALR